MPARLELPGAALASAGSAVPPGPAGLGAAWLALAGAGLVELSGVEKMTAASACGQQQGRTQRPVGRIKRLAGSASKSSESHQCLAPGLHAPRTAAPGPPPLLTVSGCTSSQASTADALGRPSTWSGGRGGLLYAATPRTTASTSGSPCKARAGWIGAGMGSQMRCTVHEDLIVLLWGGGRAAWL